jgi:hypothetical protein
MKVILGFITILYLTLFVHAMTKAQSGVNEWMLQNIGDVKFLHFLYSNGRFLGIFTITHQGSLALLDPKNGYIIWRRPLLIKRPIQSVIYQNLRTLLTQPLDALITLEDGTSAEMWNMRTGAMIEAFPLTHNENKTLHVDTTFTGSSDEGNPSFVLLSNEWLEVYSDFEEKMKIQATYLMGVILELNRHLLHACMMWSTSRYYWRQCMKDRMK